ncbi:MAG: TlpA family protein disulfide reductase [Pyrinomonadaceae bacterium]
MKKYTFTSILLTILFAAVYSASAQSVVFTSIDGEKVDVEAQKGKVVVMAIGASWLPLSNNQAGIINKLVTTYEGNDDIVFYFIATDSSSTKSKNYASNEDILKFKNKNKLNVSVLRDNDGKTSIEKFQLDQLPAFIILDKDGKVDGDPITGIDPGGTNELVGVLSGRIDKLL